MVENGEEVVEGQLLTKPIPPKVAGISGKVNYITS
jgi:hypothetical protein